MVAVIDIADRAGADYDAVAERDNVEVYFRLFPGRGERERVHA
ncbi:hypothetical protein [Rathayibacter toxicus]|nr:hypothetical protein [Rathayibacter toxicus]